MSQLLMMSRGPTPEEPSQPVKKTFLRIVFLVLAMPFLAIVFLLFGSAMLLFGFGGFAWISQHAQSQYLVEACVGSFLAASIGAAMILSSIKLLSLLVRLLVSPWPGPAGR
jgi:hypothetical protein